MQKEVRSDLSQPYEPMQNRSSKLDPFLNEIRSARANGWPFRAIVDWLEKEKSLKVSLANLKGFCDRRGLAKTTLQRVTVPAESEAIKIPTKAARKVAKQRKRFQFGKTEQEQFRKRASGEEGH